MEMVERTTTRASGPGTEGCCGIVLRPIVAEERLTLAARRFKALADPTRLTILGTLAANDGPVCACDLGDDVELGQPTVAHHLKVLRDAGLIGSERRGKWAYYSLRPAAAGWVRATLAGLPRDLAGG